MPEGLSPEGKEGLPELPPPQQWKRQSQTGQWAESRQRGSTVMLDHPCQLGPSHLGSLLASEHQPRCDHGGSQDTHMAPGVCAPSRGTKVKYLPAARLGPLLCIVGCTRASGPGFPCQSPERASGHPGASLLQLLIRACSQGPGSLPGPHQVA